MEERAKDDSLEECASVVREKDGGRKERKREGRGGEE